MNEDTPLTEVAHHLPALAANALGTYHVDVQIAVLTTVRSSVVYLERMGVVLDPTAYEAVISALTLSLTPAYNDLRECRLFVEGMAP